MKGRNIKTQEELGGHCLHWLVVSMVNTSKLYPVPCGKEKKEKNIKKEEKKHYLFTTLTNLLYWLQRYIGWRTFFPLAFKRQKRIRMCKNIKSISIAKKQIQNKLPIHSPSTWSGHITCISVEKSTPEPSTPASSSSWSSVCSAKSWPVCSFGINLKKKKRLILILF